MIEKDIRQLFEEIDPEGKIPQGKMEELISSIQEMEKNPPKDGDKHGDYTVRVLKDQLATEPDWRRRASIAAKIISANLE
jgi:hypothetical protein